MAGLSESGPADSMAVVFLELCSIVCPPINITSPGSQVTEEDISAKGIVLLVDPSRKYKFVELIVLRPDGPVAPVAPGGPWVPLGPIGPVAPAGPCGPGGPCVPVLLSLISFLSLLSNFTCLQNYTEETKKPSN